MQAQIVIGAVTRKEGTSKKTGKPWVKFVVHDQNTDGKYETFDAAIAKTANDHVGKPAIIDFAPSQFGNDLTSMVVDEFAQPSPVANGSLPPSSQDGAPDWDVIGLRKTRCLLWAHVLGSPAFWAEATEQGHVEAAFALASRAVELAESDIYRRDPAIKDAAIPF